MTDQQVIDACADWWWHQPRFDEPCRDVIRDKWRATLERDDLPNWHKGMRPIIERYHPHVLEGL